MTHRLSSSIKVVPSGLLSQGQIAPTFCAHYFLARGLETARLHLLGFVTTPSWKKREGGGLVCLEKQLDLLALARQIWEKPARHGALSFHIALELSLHRWF